MTKLRKRCKPDSKAMSDAVILVEWLLDQGGFTDLPNPEIAMRLGFVKRKGSTVEVDKNRLARARNHVRDFVDENDEPCCGFRLHYRPGTKGNMLALIDPSGDLGPHVVAVINAINGYLMRERQHHTESLRQIESLQALGDHALARKDSLGYRTCQSAIVDLEKAGTIAPLTMNALEAWMASL